MECTITNLFSPNRGPNTFLKKTLKRWMVFKEGKLIVAGDLNVCMGGFLSRVHLTYNTKAEQNKEITSGSLED